MGDMHLMYTLEGPSQNISERSLTERPTSTLTLTDTHIGESACIFGYNQDFRVRWKVMGTTENLLFQKSLLPSLSLNTLRPHGIRTRNKQPDTNATAKYEFYTKHNVHLERETRYFETPLNCPPILSSQFHHK